MLYQHVGGTSYVQAVQINLSIAVYSSEAEKDYIILGIFRRDKRAAVTPLIAFEWAQEIDIAADLGIGDKTRRKQIELHIARDTGLYSFIFDALHLFRRNDRRTLLLPEIQGPCPVERDASCRDREDIDSEQDDGTHK